MLGSVTLYFWSFQLPLFEIYCFITVWTKEDCQCLDYISTIVSLLINDWTLQMNCLDFVLESSKGKVASREWYFFLLDTFLGKTDLLLYLLKQYFSWCYRLFLPFPWINECSSHLSRGSTWREEQPLLWSPQPGRVIPPAIKPPDWNLGQKSLQNPKDLLKNKIPEASSILETGTAMVWNG